MRKLRSDECKTCQGSGLVFYSACKNCVDGRVSVENWNAVYQIVTENKYNILSDNFIHAEKLNTFVLENAKTIVHISLSDRTLMNDNDWQNSEYERKHNI